MNTLQAEGIEIGRFLLDCVPYAIWQAPYTSYHVGWPNQPLGAEHFLRSNTAWLINKYKQIIGTANTQTVLPKFMLYRAVRALEAEGNFSESLDIQTPGYTMIKNLVDWMDNTTANATEFMDSVREVGLWHDRYVMEEEGKLAQQYKAMQKERSAFFQQQAALLQIPKLVLSVCPSYIKAVKNNYKPSGQQWDRLYEKLLVEIPRVQIFSSPYSGEQARYVKP
jgi:hypothetical protein